MGPTSFAAWQTVPGEIEFRKVLDYSISGAAGEHHSAVIFHLICGVDGTEDTCRPFPKIETQAHQAVLTASPTWTTPKYNP